MSGWRLASLLLALVDVGEYGRIDPDASLAGPIEFGCALPDPDLIASGFLFDSDRRRHPAMAPDSRLRASPMAVQGLARRRPHLAERAAAEHAIDRQPVVAARHALVALAQIVTIAALLYAIYF